MAAAAPGEAHAWTNYYCGVNLNSLSWCGDGTNHTYDSNRATASGWYVCERLLWADVPWIYNGEHCAWNSIYSYYGYNGSNLLEAEVTHGHSGVRVTVYGTAVA
jgi:hypothetical protein